MCISLLIKIKANFVALQIYVLIICKLTLINTIFWLYFSKHPSKNLTLQKVLVGKN